MFRSFRQVLVDFVSDDCPTLAAAFAYYTVFSLPPLLFLLETLLTVSLSLFSESAEAEIRASKLIELHAASLLGIQTIQEEVGEILTNSLDRCGDRRFSRMAYQTSLLSEDTAG